MTTHIYLFLVHSACISVGYLGVIIWISFIHMHTSYCPYIVKYQCITMLATRACDYASEDILQFKAIADLLHHVKLETSYKFATWALRPLELRPSSPTPTPFKRENNRRYSSANKIFAVLRRNRSDPLSRAMGCIGELRAGSRSAGYERFGTGNLAPLAVLVPIPKPATHLREPATSILIVLYTFECIMWVATESLWKYVKGNK